MEITTTQLLQEFGSGNRAVVDDLFLVVYDDLRARAHKILSSESPGHTLQPTALLHEAYIRLIDQHSTTWKDKAHFCAVAALVMRRILVDHARKKGTRQRLGKELEQTRTMVSLDNPDDVLLVNDLIENLREKSEIQAKIVELRFFGDLTVAEVAEALGVSKRSVEADWTMIRAMLRLALNQKKVT